MEIISDKKKLKSTKLFDAAYELFVSKGMHDTVIDDIVKKAGVAKGTFYLYFKDKYDLIDKMVMRKSSTIIQNTFAALEKQRKIQPMDLESEVVFFIDYLMNFFGDNVELLTIIHKNLFRGLYCDTDMVNPEMTLTVQKFTERFTSRGYTVEQAHQTLYIIVEMVDSVCFDTITTGKPFSIQAIQPTLYRLIHKMLC